MRVNKSMNGGRSSFWKRLPKAMVLLIIGIFLECLMVLMIFQARYERRSQAYAVITSTGYETDVPIGLISFMNSIAAVESYSNTAEMVSLTDSEENVLAGASAVDSYVIRRQLFQQGVAESDAGRLGILAQNLVISNSMDGDDYWALVRITEAETTDTDIMSKMMVAGVVLNRVEDDRFPDTIYDVVFQEGQFSPVEDGRYYSCTVTDDTFEAVDRVLLGEDYSQGALYFLAMDSADAAKAEWFESDLTWLFSYGGHDFYTY